MFRKIFIDSRWRTTGNHNDFQIELPNDIATTATTTVYLASCSFSNTFQTVTAGVNDKLYLLSQTLNNGQLIGAPFPEIVVVEPGIYTGSTLAAELQTKLRAAVLDGSFTVSFDNVVGTLTLSGTFRHCRFPSEGELRSAAWKQQNWPGDYSTADPQSLNSMLFFPRPSAMRASTTTGNIDLVPYREVYLHSSLTNFQTLKSGTGERDCLARIPIDSNFGTVVVWKHLGSTDSMEASNERLRTISFSFRDWAGRLVPIDQPVVIELVLLDHNPYNL